jgi:TPR repeat protein
MPEYEPESYRYRVYLGVALAILLSVFIYMAWRSTLAGRSASHQLPAPIPAAAPEAVEQPASSSNEPALAPSAPGKASTAESETKAASTPHPSAPHPKVAPSSPAPQSAESPSATPSSPAISAKGNGTEELAIALSYLNGTPGKARDDGEAAKWLWKSVAKHNDTAALMLSDLYLRGSGVGKNCDQARLLLDAAARKNVAGAAERLRNLQAFSCQ